MKQEANIILEDKWLKAAVLGSLWASFEIIVGSLLHNLRVPFTGTFLTFFAVILLVSFSRIWPQKGVIIRAGIICALMKSISPSAVILGPMIGIFTEALIIEVFLRLLGRNLAGYIISGALAVLSSLIHKLANLLIIYGFDLIEVYVNMVNYAASRLRMTGFSPEEILYYLIGIYLILGAFGGITGNYIGTKASMKNRVSRSFKLSENNSKILNSEGKYSIPLLFFHLVFIFFSLLFFEKSDNLFYKTGIAAVYLVFNLLYYKNIARRLLKPWFWVQLLIILILAGLFMETSDLKDFSLSNVIENGWNLFIRAMLVITAFSSISTELANPDIKALLIKKGFRKLYMSLQLAFSALPVMLERNSNMRSFFKNPVHSFSMLIADAENWLNSFKEQNKS